MDRAPPFDTLPLTRKLVDNKHVLLVAAMGVLRTFELVKQTQQSAEKTEIDFVFVELTVGITTCKIARSRRQLGLDVEEYLKHAELALSTANRSMMKFAHKHPEFDQMTALAERVRMELTALKN
jgi:hypothetical protein